MNWMTKKPLPKRQSDRMQIKPPEPEVVTTQQLRHRMGAMSLFLIGFAILLVVTLIAWLTLWGGGIKQAAQTDKVSPAGQGL